MPQRPWMKFYPADWRADELLGMCTLAARGLWIEMIGIMHSADPYGHLLVSGRPPTDTQLAALARCPQDQIPGLLDELESVGVFSRTRTGVIYSRRMTRDERRSKDGRIAKITKAKVPNSRSSQAIEKQGRKSTTLKVEAKVIAKPPSPQKPERKTLSCLDDSSVSSLRSETAARPLDLKRELWASGKRLLVAYGKTADQAGTVIGRWCKTHSHGAILDALSKADAATPGGDIIGYIEGILRRSGPIVSDIAMPAATSAEDGEIVWRVLMRNWRDREYWPENKGPPPGMPGCQIPDRLLDEFQLAGATP